MNYNKAWEVAYNRDRARGQRRYVPADATRSRLQHLADAHVPLRAIASATGLSDTAIGQLVAGRHDRVQRNTAERIATLTLADVLGQAGGNVPSIGSTRRILVLMAIGWRKVDLEAAGVPSAQLVTRDRALVSAEGWRATRDVYERLSMTFPEGGYATRTRNYAKRMGWLPPLAWDDIDAPDGLAPGSDTTDAVDPVVVERILAGDWRLRANRAERAEVIRRWSGSLNELERLTGWNVWRDRREEVA